jgi:4-hydroxybenzoate polyprenyltransferase
LYKAFLKLVRWPNLVFIIITQVLFSYAIIQPAFQQAQLKPNIHGLYFILLVIASVFIAAAGYIINDYFDINIDSINKPEKLIVDKIINRRWVLAWHLVLSLIGVGIGFYIDRKTGVMMLGFANMISVVLLFFYSISLKKKLLIGNILISILSAWVVLVITWCESRFYINALKSDIVVDLNKITRLTFLYAGFAFIISLIREVIKDLEDMEGDRRYGCKTMPIVWGINASKVFIAVWLIVLIATLIIIQVYAIQLKWWLSIVYTMLFVIIPLFKIFKELYKAKTPQDYHQLSTWVKWVMFSGIVSMIFFKYYSL